ncbi:MAG: glucosamine-6-phosphate deaminase [Clostridiaceae bacterium]|nr:glucosamine-6-phosphate deaminase [Clostridiaceae bacterium]
MQVIVTENFDQSCEYAAKIIADVVRNKPDARLGLATGGTAEAIYPFLVREYKEKNLDFSKVSTVNLDEYVGLEPDHPQSYRYFMDRNLFDFVNIDKKNTYIVSGVGDVEKNLADFKQKLSEKPIDIQLLGIGPNGHIGFNEPGSALKLSAHIETLNESTIQANSRFFQNKDEVPRRAITMGIGDIMRAKRIVLVATGEKKADAIRGLILGDELNFNNPSTVIKVHPDATVIIDRELANIVGYKAE